jgi:uncharacterized protein (TIGR02217 family)
MSNAVYPTLPGLQFNVVKTPKFSTVIMPGVSGKEWRAAMMANPLYTIGLTYAVLRDDPTTQSPASPQDELKQLMGFFMARQGSFDSFLFTEPSDSHVTGMQFGTGDGTTNAFQLVRTYGIAGIGEFTEPVANLNGSPVIYDNGVVVAAGNYTVGATGLITFTTPPASGHALTWDGQYYYRCRFNADTIGFNQFMSNLWEAKKVELYGSLGTKI